LHTRLAAETHLADGQLHKIAVNREEFIKLQGRTGTPVVSKRDEQHLDLNKQK